MIVQDYETDVGKEYVIKGNDALMKCSIPSFVADSVQVVSWSDSEGVIITKEQHYSNGNDFFREAAKLWKHKQLRLVF